MNGAFLSSFFFVAVVCFKESKNPLAVILGSLCLVASHVVIGQAGHHLAWWSGSLGGWRPKASHPGLRLRLPAGTATNLATEGVNRMKPRES